MITVTQEYTDRVRQKYPLQIFFGVFYNCVHVYAEDCYVHTWRLNMSASNYWENCDKS